jgi:hypothetical protein
MINKEMLMLTGRNVIRRALSLHLDQNRQIGQVLSIPLLKKTNLK